MKESNTCYLAIDKDVIGSMLLISLYGPNSMFMLLSYLSLFSNSSGITRSVEKLSLLLVTPFLSYQIPLHVQIPSPIPAAGKFIVPSKVLYSFTLIRIGSTATMVIIKVVHSAPMIVANFIDRYLPGILAVSMNRLLYLVPFGRITGAYSSYSSSHRPDLPSLPTPPLEPFPSFDNSFDG